MGCQTVIFTTKGKDLDAFLVLLAGKILRMRHGWIPYHRDQAMAVVDIKEKKDS